MHFKIHRGAKEIGGSCVEVWSSQTRIVIDLGMPLVDKDGSDFDFRKYKSLSVNELISNGVLPDIKGLYKGQDGKIDAILISHAHQDHFGFLNYIKPEIPVYLGAATESIIEINKLFLPSKIDISFPVNFKKEKMFRINDLEVVAYWADHSSFDSYSFYVSDGHKSLFYSGDFRSHGRKSQAFYRFLHNAPKNIDYLLLEGTTMSRSFQRFASETDLEKRFVKSFSKQKSPHLIYTSGQNIDRLTTIYRACLKSNKTMVVDVYTAKVLREISNYARTPYASKSFPQIKVFYPYFLCSKLVRDGREDILHQFVHYKITKEEISDGLKDIVMIVRPSMLGDLNKINGLSNGMLIYSMWEGYLKKSNTKRLVTYLKNKGFEMEHIHTSGHADIIALKQMVDAIDPKFITPIHTFEPERYSSIYSQQVKIVDDRDEVQI